MTEHTTHGGTTGPEASPAPETVVHVGGEPGTAGAYDVVVGRGIAARVRDLVPENILDPFVVFCAHFLRSRDHLPGPRSTTISAHYGLP